MKQNYYEILGIDRSANLPEIQQAVQLKRNAIKLALTVLLDVDRRRSYDAKLCPGQPDHYTTLTVSQVAKPDQIHAAAQAKLKVIKEACENWAITQDYYNKLGISRSANLPEIKQAAQTRGNEVKLAFATLSRSDTRTAYDAKTNPGPHDHYTTLIVSREADLASIKVAAQARMKEIKEAYENLSQPEIRAAYDSLLPPEKPPGQRSPPLPPQPKQEEIIIQPKSVPPQDNHKSQVSPYQAPAVSPTNTDSEAQEQEIELAGRGTRLLAVMVDFCIIMAPYWLLRFSLHINFDNREQFARVVAEELIAAPIFWYFISVIIINLVLLYHYGQTIGKCLFSIKIVKPGLVVVKVFPDRQRRPANKRTLLFLTLVLGWLGAHRFYLGSHVLGILYLLFCWTMIPGLMALLEFLVFLVISNKFLEDNYTAHNSARDFVPITIFVIFMLIIASNIHYLKYRGKISEICDCNGIPPKSSLGSQQPKEVLTNKELPKDKELSVADYLRYKVSEAIRILNSMKPRVEGYIAVNGRFPAIDIMLTNEPSIKYTARLKSNPEEFYLEATMNNEDSILAGKVVRVVRLTYPYPKAWTCSAAYSNGIPQEYLPSDCKE